LNAIQFRPLSKSMPARRRPVLKKPRSLEVTAPDRWNGKPLETTYQRAYCTRPYGKTRPAETALGRSADLGGETR
jgi:hypothetical protein